MGTCIKTGSMLRIVTTNITGILAESLKYEANISSDHLHGDTHLIGNCCVIYFPEYQGHKPEKDDGNLFILDPNDYFYRDTKPYKTLVVPAHWVEFKEESLHPLDWQRYREKAFIK